ncbi:hypothetical protein BJV74DRAFT_452936 [Russula compacta]|nr:hypothetical protein BJV74DRAFT_452936 [Russula compacta]
MLRSMCEDYPSLADDIQLAAVTEYRLTIEDLPSPEQEKECASFASRLCRDLYAFNFEAVAAIQEFDEDGWHGSPSHSSVMGTKQGEGVPTPLPEPFLGDIGQETLTQAISRDELDPRRKKAPWLSYRINWSFTPPFPADVLPVGRWIRSQFGRRHPVTATCMNHAVVNDDHAILHNYLSGTLIVPVTLHHFKMLARLGRAPNYLLFHAIKNGAGFFFSDNDYLKHPDVEVKRETPCAETMPSGTAKNSSLSIELSSGSSPPIPSVAPTRKRLHRSAAATVKSYAYDAQTDSDDEIPIHGMPESSRRTRIRTVESNLQLWIKHLSALHKDETKKVGTVPLGNGGRGLSFPVQREETGS